MAGRAGVGRRQPEMEGQEAGLEPEAQDGQQQDPGIQGGGVPGREGQPEQVSTAVRQQDHHGRQQDGPGVGADQVDPAGAADLRSLVVRADQEEGRDGHESPRPAGTAGHAWPPGGRSWPPRALRSGTGAIDPNPWGGSGASTLSRTPRPGPPPDARGAGRPPTRRRSQAGPPRARRRSRVAREPRPSSHAPHRCSPAGPRRPPASDSTAPQQDGAGTGRRHRSSYRQL